MNNKISNKNLAISAYAKAKLNQITDTETGCYGAGDNAQLEVQACRQAYFLNQQNKIANKSDESLATENSKLENELKETKKELSTLKSQQGSENVVMTSQNLLLLVLLILVVIVVTSTITTKIIDANKK